ncbi:hypothetical protein Plec18167_000665 [Paecilomyces lecythidis]|uniref:Heme oxygenase-like protein n=1 Tax=Paecilomyces lecythidis TaxID=3004212 RepID=A0ABR3YEL3_9EURO
MDTLTAKIHAATRAQHKTLNRLITARLPLGLPPHANSPQLYALGLSRIAEVYYAFERTWLRQINASDQLAEAVREDYDVLGSFVNDNAGRIRNVLRQVYLPRILKSRRLRSDLRALRTSGSGEIKHGDARKNAAGGSRTAVEAFALHIERTISSKPHVILAYAWLMYMALFNGGRWIRDRLIEGGPAFWTDTTSSPSRDTCPLSQRHHRAHLTESYLSFWFFDSDQDGEDIKLEFKKRMDVAGDLLTEVEQTQVIAEAVEIFYRLEQIVAEIDLDIARGIYRDSRVLQSADNFVSVSLPLSLLSQNIARHQAPPRTYIRPLLVGMAGLLGGICAWLWRVNADAVQWSYHAWAGEDDLAEYTGQRSAFPFTD